MHLTQYVPKHPPHAGIVPGFGIAGSRGESLLRSHGRGDTDDLPVFALFCSGGRNKIPWTRRLKQHLFFTVWRLKVPHPGAGRVGFW